MGPSPVSGGGASVLFQLWLWLLGIGGGTGNQGPSFQPSIGAEGSRLLQAWLL